MKKNVKTAIAIKTSNRGKLLLDDGESSMLAMQPRNEKSTADSRREPRSGA